MKIRRRVLAALLLAGIPAAARAFLGVADTSFVTVIANPAEAANWAAELDRLNSELAAANGTLATVNQLRSYAGDPRAAAAGVPDLAAVTAGVQALAAGGQTAGDLEAAWRALGSAGQAAAAAALLRAAGPGATMEVFGQAQARDPALYGNETADTARAQAVRGQIAAEQASRGAIAAELAGAWARFRAAATESAKQAVLTEISQLQAQDQAMGARRQALLADFDLADRQERDQVRVRAAAANESSLAESALLQSAAAARAQGAEAQRLATLQKPAPTAPAADYSGLRVWTTADAGGSPP